MPWTLLCSVAVSVNKNVERKRETLRWNHIEPKSRNAAGLWRETGARGREATWSPDSFPELIPSFCSLCFLLILGLRSGSSVQAEQESVSQSKYVGKKNLNQLFPPTVRETVTVTVSGVDTWKVVHLKRLPVAAPHLQVYWCFCRQPACCHPCQSSSCHPRDLKVNSIYLEEHIFF